MFMIAFFATVFSSVCWFIYAVMFVKSSIGDLAFNALSPESMLTYAALVFLPVMVIWVIFGYVNQFFINRGMNRKQTELLRQLQKNQDYTDLVVRVMLDAEHEIKDGFVLNKFDIFVSDMNEALGEIIQRCNIASSAQLEQLWQRVRRGERWTLGKAILDASKNQSTFNVWAQEKVSRDKVFRGSLLEFCSRYQNLLQLLEKHDRDRVFLRMIETGVLGKVYSIIAPLSEGLQPETIKENIQAGDERQDYASVLKIATIEEPRADETIVNVDKTEDDELDAVSYPRRSFLSRLNPFKRREEDDFSDETSEDPFFQALHSSFQEQPSVSESNKDISFSSSEEEIGITPERNDVVSEPMLQTDFSNSRSTLDSLRSTNDSFSDFSVTRDDVISSEKEEIPLDERQEPSFGQQERYQHKSSLKEEDDEDLVYPFGGWTDEKNYHS